MSTLDATVSLLETLSEEQLLCIQELAKRLAKKSKNNPYAPMSEAELLAELAEAREDEREGRIKDADQAIRDLREKYGL